MSEFITYEKLRTQQEIKEIVELLEAHHIEYSLEDSSINFDVSFANNESNKEYRIKLKKEDFEKANEIRDHHSIQELNEVSSDHYLFQFTNDELVDLISKKDEWSSFDFVLAKKILKDRGQEISENQINQLHEERIEELSKPEKDQMGWIILGYILAFLGGLLACLIGGHLMMHKKTLPNGERIYAYSENDRKHGTRILVLGISFTLIWLVVRIMVKLN